MREIGHTERTIEDDTRTSIAARASLLLLSFRLASSCSGDSLPFPSAPLSSSKTTLLFLPCFPPKLNPLTPLPHWSSLDGDHFLPVPSPMSLPSRGVFGAPFPLLEPPVELAGLSFTFANGFNGAGNLEAAGDVVPILIDRGGGFTVFVDDDEG